MIFVRGGIALGDILFSPRAVTWAAGWPPVTGVVYMLHVLLVFNTLSVDTFSINSLLEVAVVSPMDHHTEFVLKLLWHVANVSTFCI